MSTTCQGAAETPRAPTPLRALRKKANNVLEFAWGSGILDINCDDYHRLVRDLFPRAYKTDRAAADRIRRLRNRKRNRLFLPPKKAG